MLEKDLNIKDTNKQRRKLVDYLNEYEEGLSGEKGHFTYESRFDEVHLISKKFGFIKWLVDNDKIGRNKNSDRSAMIDLMRVEVKEQTDVFEGIEKYEWYIMILSIQDNPIEFLISILK